MSEGSRLARTTLERLKDYLRAGTLEKGVVSASLTAIGLELGMSSATVHRAVKALQNRGLSEWLLGGVPASHNR